MAEGKGKKKEYTVTVKQIVYSVYSVEAESPEEAEQKYENGEARHEDSRVAEETVEEVESSYE